MELEKSESTYINDSAVNDKKSLAQQNMDDMVARTMKKKVVPTATTTEDIAKLSKSEIVNNALLKSL
jgi:hypothetical protein